jgi:hypothetical protein
MKWAFPAFAKNAHRPRILSPQKEYPNYAKFQPLNWSPPVELPESGRLPLESAPSNLKRQLEVARSVYRSFWESAAD